MKDLNIVLVEPEIPQNTGNIARTCAATGAALHLVKPMGFAIDDKKLKRAGLDYWHLLDITYYESFAEFLARTAGGVYYPASTKAKKIHSEMPFEKGGYLVFGKETRGLPEPFIEAHLDTAIRLPMIRDARSLNLSNSVAVVIYEALRQWGYPGLSTAGALTGRPD